MFPLVLALFVAFLFFSKYVVFNDSINSIPNEHVGETSIPNNSSKIKKLEKDGVVLLYCQKPEDKDYLNVLYHSRKPNGHYVYKKTFWFQTISIKKEYLSDFVCAFVQHINKCYKGSSVRESVNVCRYASRCAEGCRMYKYEKDFITYEFRRYLANNVNMELGSIQFIKEGFFDKERHLRKKKWEEFFDVVKSKFQNKSGRQIYSEKDNREYTYLYLLTKNYMYETGFHIRNKILFLYRIDLKLLFIHRVIKLILCPNLSDDFLFEMPFEAIYTTEGPLKRGLYIFPNGGCNKDQQFQKKKVPVRSPFRGNAKGKVNGEVLNQDEFESMFWKDICNVYNGQDITKQKINYYNTVMPLI